MSRLEGKVVFVTGSARRVGRAIALAFAVQGANLVIHHASPGSADDAQSVAEEVRKIGGEAIVVDGNQAESSTVKHMFDTVATHYGRLDVMVNSAAIFKRTELLDISEAEWDLVMEINLKGPFLLTQQAARLMINGNQEPGGAIINISDNSGLNAWASRPHHSISKAGVIMLTQVSALALAQHQIRVNCVIPGPVLVPAGADESVLDDIAAALPVGHIGNPGNVADACIFLVNNDFTTGTILRVDGGEGLAGGET
ncbi:MAG: SDR family oxidoreductase [Chloroflexi bacterium]|nr:SDR family oxidoreductase [Chloroflexota bacterium]